jgi:hypothetical protein
MIDSVLLNQFHVGATLHYSASVNHTNKITGTDGRKTMGDNECCPSGIFRLSVVENTLYDLKTVMHFSYVSEGMTHMFVV